MKFLKKDVNWMFRSIDAGVDVQVLQTKDYPIRVVLCHAPIYTGATWLSIFYSMKPFTAGFKAAPVSQDGVFRPLTNDTWLFLKETDELYVFNNAPSTLEFSFQEICLDR